MTEDLEKLSVKLLEAARKLPPGSERRDILKELGSLRSRIATGRVHPEAKAGKKKIARHPIK